jgi:hypothetical protein
MSTNRRLDRLYGALTPRERAALVLRAWKDGREPDSRLLRSTTDREAVEYNRILGLLSATNGGLTQFLVIIHLLVGQLEIKFSWYLTVLLWDNASLQSNRNNRASEIAEALLDGLVEGIGMRWRELRSLEIVLAQIAEEVDGEDVLHQDARELFDRTKEQVQILCEDVVRRGGKCKLEEPTDEEVEALAVRIKETAR